MENAKPAWQSKTMILNAIMGVITAVAVFVPGAEVVKDFLNAHMAEVGFVWSVLNLILRAITKDAIVLGE